MFKEEHLVIWPPTSTIMIWTTKVKPVMNMKIGFLQTPAKMLNYPNSRSLALN
jgi:hypothetical protein